MDPILTLSPDLISPSHPLLYSADANLKKRQLTAREQFIELIGEEFTKKWESLTPNMKVNLAGMPKDDFIKQPASIKSFCVGSSNNTPKKQRNNTPKQHLSYISSQTKNRQLLSRLTGLYKEL